MARKGGYFEKAYRSYYDYLGESGAVETLTNDEKDDEKDEEREEETVEI